jgi:hypothetical protein
MRVPEIEAIASDPEARFSAKAMELLEERSGKIKRAVSKK